MSKRIAILFLFITALFSVSSGNPYLFHKVDCRTNVAAAPNHNTYGGIGIRSKRQLPHNNRNIIRIKALDSDASYAQAPRYISLHIPVFSTDANPCAVYKPPYFSHGSRTIDLLRGPPALVIA